MKSKAFRMIKCAILGASGHGKVIAELAELNGFKEIIFFDDRFPELMQLAHWQVKGCTTDLLALVQDFDLVVVAIGNNSTRLQKLRVLQQFGAKLVPLVHPHATVSGYAQLGEGTVVMAHAVVNAFATVGVGGIINTSATVDHDCVLADGVHISPGAHLAGGVCVGEHSWIGIGAQVNQLICIGNKVIVGAGATVIRDIPDFQTVVGTPAVVISH
ncbi:MULTISPECIES: acetyltransferase [Aeromonas]|uniref:dTDP-D-Fuc3N acetylase n=1 Tax=Aeromonas hydrophila TaxID=644 RepID=A0A346ACH2_AERHY|nr:acetyltransferase [Aeromonas veronii]AXL04934.1 dTDP-D-Fuc3N acetylase [Aeromonas hydrophila]MCX0429256.1 acetyltransferase [Aeromonas veronii]UZE58455.1 acetyltransferase [Aeromonas veronii]